MKALITGGAGFIGSHLAETLLHEGYEVIVIDDLSTGRMNNIIHLRDNPSFTFFNDTIFNFRLMEKAVVDCDIIFHLAASVGVKYVIDNPVESIRINIRGTEIALELASRYDKKIFLASSSEVYGKNKQPKLREDEDILFGGTKVFRWSYAHAKAIDEFLGLAYYRERKLRVYIARLFNTVGPRQIGRYGMVVPRFVDQALRGEPITVYGDGKQVRAFCHVKDTIAQILGLINSDKGMGEVCNIGNDMPITIGELAELVKKLTKSSSEIKFVPYENAYGKDFEDLAYRVPDLTRIKTLTGYQPQMNVQDTLLSVIESKKKEPNSS